MSSKYGGYMGKVVQVDLSTGTVSPYPWSDRDRELFIGGKIMAAKILSDHLTGTEEPFSDRNLLVIATGPLTGTGAPSSSRFNISTLSPQTGLLASSNCGGNFGYYLKKAGYDALILRGQAKEHTWLEITNDKFVFHNADELWGKKTSATQQALSALLTQRGGPDKSGKLCIGPAGENRVLYASIVSNERISGRTGMGAIMGWMNLKAITVTGNHVVRAYNPEKMMSWNRKWFRYLRSHPLTGEQLPRIGTAGLVSQMQMRHILATENFRYGQNESFEKVNGERLAEDFNLVNKGCLTCPIRCARTVAVDGQEVKGPELETLGLLGGGIRNDNMELLLRWNYELDELGMDSISAAGTLAWAMEANEKGIWNCGLNFGQVDGISQLWEDIAHRRGIGDELADGSRRLSEKYGGKEFAIHSKGLELSAYEPRHAVGMGLGYAVSNRGGCHLNGGYLVILEGLGMNIDAQTPKAKADLTVMFQNLMEMISATGQCLFTSYAFFPAPLLSRPNAWYTRAANKLLPHIGMVIRLLNRCPRAVHMHLSPVFHHTRGFQYATGMPMTFGDYMNVGSRGYTLERSVNCRFGVSAKDDTLPKRLTDEPQQPNNPRSRVPLKKMTPVYYAARGWDSNGIPTPRTLEKLGLKGAD